MTNAYLRAAAGSAELREKAAKALERRKQDENLVVDDPSALKNEVESPTD